MSNQPEALYLAEVIESDPQSKSHHDAAASCLRRQHAEIEAAQQAQRDAENELYRTMARHAMAEAELKAEAGRWRSARDVFAKRMDRCKHDLRMLRNAVDAMMAPLGYHGTISARDDRVQRVMDAMAASDWAAMFEADEGQDEQP